MLSAGLAAEADTLLTDQLVQWADAIFVMERGQRGIIERRHRAALGDKRIVCLNIPDRYRFMDVELVALLRQRMATHIR